MIYILRLQNYIIMDIILQASVTEQTRKIPTSIINDMNMEVAFVLVNMLLDLSTLIKKNPLIWVWIHISNYLTWRS